MMVMTHRLSFQFRAHPLKITDHASSLLVVGIQSRHKLVNGLNEGLGIVFSEVRDLAPLGSHCRTSLIEQAGNRE